MKRTSRNRQPGLTLVFFAVIALGLFVSTLLLRSTFAGLFWRVFSPVMSHNPLSAVSIALSNKAKVAAENDMLKGELAKTAAALADRDVLYRENSDLKNRMGRDQGARSVLAGVIMRPPGVPYDTLLIDAGHAQGIAVGHLVSGGGTLLIGRVDEVYATTARVVLFSAASETHQALLLETTSRASTPITVEGQGGGSLVAEVPAHTNVSVGDAVVFPGIAGGLTAVVSHVDAKSGESFERIYLHLPMNPLQLRFVEVLAR